jgi:hypothetical protein
LTVIDALFKEYSNRDIFYLYDAQSSKDMARGAFKEKILLIDVEE